MTAKQYDLIKRILRDLDELVNDINNEQNDINDEQNEMYFSEALEHLLDGKTISREHGMIKYTMLNEHIMLSLADGSPYRAIVIPDTDLLANDWAVE